MIMSPNYPLDGPYDSLDTTLIRRQLTDLSFSGIDGSIVSWWGIGDYSDQVLDALVETAGDTGYRITLYYETPMVARRRGDMSVAQRVVADLASVLERHAASPAWLKMDGKPVVVVYMVDTQPLEIWREVKEGLIEAGFDPFFLGDSFNLETLSVMDGLHTYNPVSSLIRGEALASKYTAVANAARERDKLFAATVLPGYDDRKIRSPGIYLPRENGGCYHRTWYAALTSEADWVLVTSWNEWYEDSEIEPSVEHGMDYLYLTAQYARVLKGL
jgi:glycoprotein endo-alpha-1,2-mannosidase